MRRWLADIFPREEPLGAHLHIGDGLNNPRLIIGVVANERIFGLKSLADPIMYIPYSQGRFEGGNAFYY